MNIHRYYAHLPRSIKNIVRFGLHLSGRYRRRTYSQEGEDILLARLFDSQKRTGFYVDVGAHHPSRCSNTYYFYKRGWRGINIDAMPGSMDLFRLIRHRDINLETAVSEKRQIIELHSFNNPLFNSADAQLAESRRIEFNEPRDEHNVFMVQADTLESILDRHLPADIKVDFLTIDVEGLDLNVLKSNDWSRFRPTYILVEILDKSILTLIDTEIYKYLVDHGYEPMSKLVHTVLFRDCHR